jgi:putative nucleotidyltransferase with HDIG domain
VSLNIPELSQTWRLWSARPDAAFTKLPVLRQSANFRLLARAATLILVALLVVVTVQYERRQVLLAESNQNLEVLVGERTTQLEAAQFEIVYRLAKTTELRDAETGNHNLRVAYSSKIISVTLGFDAEYQRHLFLAAMLHDIGKALDDTWDGPHAIAGMNFLKQFTETELVLNAVGAHHRDIVPSSLEAQVVIVADMLSASRPGARKVSHEDYLRRMNALEEIANSHPGVEKSFVMQSGREIRVIVKPDMMSDLEARQLAKEIGTKISANREVAGQIKITVIRESRFIELIK